MGKSKLEYLWLDGFKPTASLRGKTKIINNTARISCIMIKVNMAALIFISAGD